MTTPNEPLSDSSAAPEGSTEPQDASTSSISPLKLEISVPSNDDKNDDDLPLSLLTPTKEVKKEVKKHTRHNQVFHPTPSETSDSEDEANSSSDESTNYRNTILNPKLSNAQAMQLKSLPPPHRPRNTIDINAIRMHASSSVAIKTPKINPFEKVIPCLGNVHYNIAVATCGYSPNSVPEFKQYGALIANAIPPLEKNAIQQKCIASCDLLIRMYKYRQYLNPTKFKFYSTLRESLLENSTSVLQYSRLLSWSSGKYVPDGEAIVWVRKAADLGNAEAMAEFGWFVKLKGKLQESVSWFHQAIEGGYHEALAWVADAYENGEGVVVDLVAAAAWREKIAKREKSIQETLEAQKKKDEAMAEQVRLEAQARIKDRIQIQEAMKKRQEESASRRALDRDLNKALRNMEWGFYTSGLEQLRKLSLSGNVDATEYLDPDLSPISEKAYSAMYYIAHYHAANADPVSAVKWYRRSAEGGYHEAQVTYAAYLIVGKGIEKADPGQAMAFLMKAWDVGRNKEAALALGEAYTKGIGVFPDPSKALTWYLRAWDAGGYPEAAFAVGLAYATGFTPGAVDPMNWSAAGSVGNPNVNEVLHAHTIIQKSQDIIKGGSGEKFKETIVNPDVPSSSSESNLSQVSDITPPLTPDLRHSKPIIIKNLTAVKQNVVLAAQWYRKATDLGHSRACNNLGELYMTGRGVDRNDGVGFALFRRAAMAGLAEAEYNMGRCCSEGRGCTKDPEQAVTWLKRAQAQGIQEAASALAALEK